MSTSTVLSIIFAAFILLCYVIMAIFLVKIYKQSKAAKYVGDPGKTQEYIQGCVRAAFQQEIRKLAESCSEERRLSEWIDAQLDDEDVNIADIATSANRRSIALLIKNTEDRVSLAANDLLRISSRISHAEASLSSHIAGRTESLVIKERETLRKLKDQETQLEDRLTMLKEKQEKLTSLIAQISTETED